MKRKALRVPFVLSLILVICVFSYLLSNLNMLPFKTTLRHYFPSIVEDNAIRRIEKLGGCVVYLDQFSSDEKELLKYRNTFPTRSLSASQNGKRRVIHTVMIWGSPFGLDETDQNMLPVQNLRKIKRLDWLSDVPNIDGLVLVDCELDSRELKVVRDLKQLTMLSLHGSTVDDRAVQYLKNCKTLKTLVLGDTQVTPQGVEELRQSLPECDIRF